MRPSRDRALSSTPAMRRVRLLWRGPWALLPLLAISAYLPTLGVGFLADDYILLTSALFAKLGPQLFLPDPNWFFYRPVGMLLTWVLGWRLWGFNPLPYHIISLSLHAATALALGLAVATIAGRRNLGWLAGALFAVYPLHTEAVGWLAAQWDLWAALFASMALWLFARWWAARPRRNARVYWLAVLLFALSLFAKESGIAFLPIFALAALVITPRSTRATLRTLALALLPFASVLATYLGIRLSAWSSIGGYPNATLSAANAWDLVIADARALIAPLNGAVFGQGVVQTAGLAVSILLLAGLVFFGRQQLRLILLAGGWLICALLPILSLGISQTDLANNRFLYLPAAGYCLLLATLLHALLGYVAKWRAALGALVVLPLLLGVGTTWAQLGPWQTATAQVDAIAAEVRALAPAPAPAADEIWYVQNPPSLYKGAQVLGLGLGALRWFTDGDRGATEQVADATAAPLSGKKGRAFALRFRLDEAEQRFHIDYAAGISDNEPAPVSGSRRWDFSDCAATTNDWQPAAPCTAGTGLTVPATLPATLQYDGQIATSTRGFVRVLVEATIAPGSVPVSGFLSWRAATNDAFVAAKSQTIPLDADGQPHSYWYFLPAAVTGGTIAGLRLELPTATIVRSIRLDLLP